LDIETVLEKSKKKVQIVKGKGLKFKYLVDCYNNRYTIVRVDGDHANILIRGKKPLAIEKLKGLK